MALVARMKLPSNMAASEVEPESGGSEPRIQEPRAVMLVLGGGLCHNRNIGGSKGGVMAPPKT